jgi:hypothetical protein
MATFPISYLRDDFEDNAIGAAWTKSTTGTATGAETGGQAVFTLPSSGGVGPHEAKYASNARYDLTGDSAIVSVGTMVATGVAATAYFRLQLDDSNYVQWVQLSGTLKAQKCVAGVVTDLGAGLTWSSSTHKYWRIRESGGTIFFDTSTSASAGGTWTNRYSVTVALAIAVTALQVLFGASCANVASPGSFRLDFYNLILPTPTRNWKWTDADWQSFSRIRPITLASTGNKQGVIVTAGSKDSSGVLGGTLRYFAGPVGSSSGGYAQLTEYSTLVAAQANPFTIPIDGRVDLPAMVDCRIIRLYHASTDGAAGTLREYFPRRLLQTDDLEAENIDAMVLRAGTITADKIAVLELDAAHYITAGGGVVTLNDQGIQIEAPDLSALDSNAYTFTDPSDQVIGGLYGQSQISGATNSLTLEVKQLAGMNADIDLAASAPAGKTASTTLTAGSDTTFAVFSLFASNATGSEANATLDRFNITGGLNLGSASGAAAGEIKTSARIYPRNQGLAVSTNINGSLANNGVMALSATATFSGFALVWAGSQAAIYGIHGTTNTVQELADASGGFSPTAGNAGTINIYWSAANSRFELENKRGGAIAVRVWLFEG